MQNKPKLSVLWGVLFIILALVGFFEGMLASGFGDGSSAVNYVGMASIFLGFVFLLTASKKKEWGNADSKIYLTFAFLIEIAGIFLMSL